MLIQSCDITLASKQGKTYFKWSGLYSGNKVLGFLPGAIKPGHGVQFHPQFGQQFQLFPGHQEKVHIKRVCEEKVESLLSEKEC